MAFRMTFDDDSATKIKLNQNQQFLKDIDTMLRTRGESPWEVERLNMARTDVVSRMTPDEVAQYENTRKVTGGFDAAKLAEDLKEMDQNKDKNSI